MNINLKQTHLVDIKHLQTLDRSIKMIFQTLLSFSHRKRPRSEFYSSALQRSPAVRVFTLRYCVKEVVAHSTNSEYLNIIENPFRGPQRPFTPQVFWSQRPTQWLRGATTNKRFTRSLKHVDPQDHLQGDTWNSSSVVGTKQKKTLVGSQKNPRV